MSNTARTTFQEIWLTDSKFRDWIQPVIGKPNYARCKLCFSNIFLSNMGRQALVSHTKGKKHSTRAISQHNSGLMETFLVSKSSSVDTSVSTIHCSFQASSASTTSTSVLSANAIVLSSNEPSPITNTSLPNTSQALLANQAPCRLDTYVLKNDITTAELLWCIQTVMSHKSLRSTEKDVNILKRMLPDSEIIKKMQLKKDKIGYTIMFGIAPFFNRQLMDELNCTDFIVVGFDESLNKITKRQQMDINVRFWNNKRKEVTTRYLTSSFLGRSRAIDLIEAFKKSTKNIQINKILQISMDGPNVNWTFIKEYKSQFSNDVKLLDIGSCGLHRLHCAFKTGINATTWDIVSYLRALYNLFKDVPARRALYTQYSESNVFPLKFCSIRWLENSEVAQRAIDITPHVKKFIEGVQQDKIEPTCKSYIILTKFIKDPLLCSKLAFFKSVASDVEPFLREFQSDAPLVPFLHSALSQTLKNVLNRFMKPEVINAISSISLKDIQKESNLLNAKYINLGFDTRKTLSKIKDLKNTDVLQFHQDCKNCLKKFVCHVMIKSPLTYTLTKAVTCLDPYLIVSNLDLAKKRLDNLCSILNEKERLSGSVADTVIRQFKELTSRSHFIDVMKSYDRSKKRLDHFWRDILNENFKDFMNVVKMVCCLSHGNANIERDFSINAESLFENMREESVITRRQVYDAVSYHGGINNLEISKTFLLSVRNAHSRYLEDLELRRKQVSSANQEASLKRMKNLEAKELKIKRFKILEKTQKDLDALDEQIRALKNF